MSDQTPGQEGQVAVITDTSASIPDDLVQSLGIHLVPYYINFGNKTVRDVFDVERSQFYHWLESATKLPTTSHPGAGDYLEAFRKTYARTKEMVAITMTSIGSGAYQAASLARDLILKDLPDIQITVVDSRQVAMAQGWAVIQAARAAVAGASLAQVGKAARETAALAMMAQTADTLKYLYMGGRIGRALHLVGTLLRVKPVIGMDDGEIVALGQARSRKRAYDRMVELIEKKAGLGARLRIAYMHVAAPEEVLEIRERVERAFECVETLVTELSPALGVHSGPGTAGLAFVTME